MPKTLMSGFIQAAKRFPEHIALEIKTTRYTYARLYKEVRQLASVIVQQGKEESLIGIFSSRSFVAYQGILATLHGAKAYLPLDLSAPAERIKKVIELSGAKVFIVDAEGERALLTCIDGLAPSCFIFPQGEVPASLLPYERQHRFYGQSYLSKVAQHEFQAHGDQLPAYLLFTSGSTGEPKGVVISHANICAYIEAIRLHYPITEHDRASQAFDLTFDPSVHDMFVTWFSGATLCVMNERERLGAGFFIKKHQLTVWNTVPSIAKLLMQTLSFTDQYFTTLKRVFFNGEMLTQSVAEATQRAASVATVTNLYGLTETTVNVSHYLWHTRSAAECRNGVVPLGSLFSGHQLTLVPDPSQADVTPGNASQKQHSHHQGELLVAGPQVFAGYLQEVPDQPVFAQVRGLNFFKTGDWVLMDKNECLHFLYRTDDQIKISGYRVDLNEIRINLEQLSACPDALVLKVARDQGEVQLIGFIKRKGIHVSTLLEQLNNRLPVYMQLKKIVILKEYPYLISGKVDRKALVKKIINTGSEVTR